MQRVRRYVIISGEEVRNVEYLVDTVYMDIIGYLLVFYVFISLGSAFFSEEEDFYENWK